MALDIAPLEILKSLHGRAFGLAKEGHLILRRDNGAFGTLGLFTDKIITSAQVLALNATPKEVVAAPGAAGYALVFQRAMLYKPAGTAYAGIAATEDLAFKYTNGSGQQVSAYVEATGFLDQTTAQVRHVTALASNGTTTAGDVTPVDNANIVLQLLVGEITTGDSPLVVRTWYDIIPMTLPTS
jgi:hypothetical protein